MVIALLAHRRKINPARKPYPGWQADLKVLKHKNSDSPDMSLSFIPKIVSAVIALTVFGPWMLRTLLSYASNLIENIPAYF